MVGMPLYAALWDYKVKNNVQSLHAHNNGIALLSIVHKTITIMTVVNF